MGSILAVALADTGGNMDIVVGCAVIAASLVLQVLLVFAGRRTTDRIARRGYSSARKIMRDDHDGR